MPEDSDGEMIVRNSSAGEGAACWRQLAGDAGDALATWANLTGAKFEATDDVMVSISKLDEDMARYQKMS
eukprot:964286-Pyramimonas_sp.AAC.1